jgi:hypothetical protein
LLRELDECLGLSTLIARHLTDPRTGRNTQFPLADLFRQSIYSRLAGYEDTNDAEQLAEDPTFRMLGSRERRTRLPRPSIISGNCFPGWGSRHHADRDESRDRPLL